MKHLDSDLEQYKYKEALKEARDGELVDQAFADILNHKFESPAVHEVMQRRAGSDFQRRELESLRDEAMRVSRACGVPQ